MEASFRIEGNKIYFSFTRSVEDLERIENLSFGMSEIEPYVKINDGFDPREIHNDLIATAIILMVNPYVGKSLNLDFSVSKEFMGTVGKVISRYKISCKNYDVLTLEKARGNRPGLAFSGGADSSAALALLPKDVCIIFMNRPINENSKYDSSAPLQICNHLDEIGFDVEIVETDLEYLREPVGFPTDLAHSIPIILHSEYLEIDSIAFGTVLESGYRLGHDKYIDYSTGSHYRFFSTLFSAVGLELNLPTIGISEVGTAIIGSKAPGGILQQSCIRGKLFHPCYRCWKCFRKELLNYALGISQTIPNFDEMMRSNEVQIRLSAYPISHENVITYSLQRVKTDDIKNLKILVKKLDMEMDLNYLEEWYSPSIKFIPEQYRFFVREKIINYLSIMRLENEKKVMNWSMEEHIKSSSAKLGQVKLLNLWKEINHK